MSNVNSPILPWHMALQLFRPQLLRTALTHTDAQGVPYTAEAARALLDEAQAVMTDTKEPFVLTAENMDPAEVAVKRELNEMLSGNYGAEPFRGGEVSTRVSMRKEHMGVAMEPERGEPQGFLTKERPDHVLDPLLAGCDLNPLRVNLGCCPDRAAMFRDEHGVILEPAARKPPAAEERRIPDDMMRDVYKTALDPFRRPNNPPRDTMQFKPEVGDESSKQS